jgi:hypothetical protein
MDRAFTSGYAQATCVQFGNHVVHGIAHFFGCVGRANVGAVVPGVVDDVLELVLSHGCLLYVEIN